MPIVIQIIDKNGAPTGETYGAVASTVFKAVDDSLTEANGWKLVRMKKAQFTTFFAEYLKTRRIGLDGAYHY